MQIGWRRRPSDSKQIVCLLPTEKHGRGLAMVLGYMVANGVHTYFRLYAKTVLHSEQFTTCCFTQPKHQTILSEISYYVSRLVPLASLSVSSYIDLSLVLRLCLSGLFLFSFLNIFVGICIAVFYSFVSGRVAQELVIFRYAFSLLPIFLRGTVLYSELWIEIFLYLCCFLYIQSTIQSCKSFSTLYICPISVAFITMIWWFQ